MGDDADNGIYMIEMPDEASLGGLMGVILHGGNGNTWPVSSTSTCWNIYSNTGKIADVIPENDQINYISRDGSEPLSSLGITWVYGGHEEPDLDIAIIERSHSLSQLN